MQAGLFERIARLGVRTGPGAGELALTALRSLDVLAAKYAADEKHVFTVAADLDGTLAVQERPFDKKTVGRPRAEAKKWMTAFREAGARLIIFTVRGDTELVRAWLVEHDIPFDHVNENPDQPEDSSGKILADVYWDDRAVDARAADSGQEVLDRIRAAKKKKTKE